MMESENVGIKSAQQKGIDGDEDFEVVHKGEEDTLDIGGKSTSKPMEFSTPKHGSPFSTADVSGFSSADISNIGMGSERKFLDDTTGSTASYHTAITDTFNEPEFDFQDITAKPASSADFISAEMGESYVPIPSLDTSPNFGGGGDEYNAGNRSNVFDETLVDTDEVQIMPKIGSDETQLPEPDTTDDEQVWAVPTPPEPLPVPVEVYPARVEMDLAPVEIKPAPVEIKPAPVEIKPAPVEIKAAPVEVKPKAEPKPAPVGAKKELVAGKPSECTEICEPMELFCKMGLVGDLVYWRDPKKSGIVFGSGLGVLLSLSFFSLISVIAYLSLLALTATICYRIYKNVLQAVQKTSDGHPFKDILDLDLTLPQDKVREVTDIAVAHVNAALLELRRLFLVEDLVDSIKFGVLLWCLTYLGAWFNGMTLIIIAFVAMFTLPKVYENNKSQIDQNLDIVRAKLADISAKVKAAVPIGKKPVVEEKKEQ